MVRFADAFSRVLISAGGIGAILAVSGVFAFLVIVAFPLFNDADVSMESSGEEGSFQAPLAMALGDQRLLGWRLLRTGKLEVFRHDTGEVREIRDFYEPGEVSCASVPLEGELYAFGSTSGIIRLSRLEFKPQFLNADRVEQDVIDVLETMPLGDPVDYRKGVIYKTPRGQYRYQSLDLETIGEVQISDGPVRSLDHVSLSEGPLMLAVAKSRKTDADVAIAVRGTETDDFFTGGKVFAFEDPVELELPEGAPPPDFLALSGTGRELFLAWNDGLYQRLHSKRSLSETYLVERGRLVAEGDELCFLQFGLGQNTLVWGDSNGAIRAAFLVRLSDIENPEALLSTGMGGQDGFGLVVTKELREKGPKPTAFASSHRSRVIAVGFEDGTIDLYNITTEALLSHIELPDGASVQSVVMAPKDDGMLVITEDNSHSYSIELMHPEAAFGALFGRVWYEGYGGPRHTWQSSSGHAGYEPKLGLIPLVVGTLKATFYSMLFGAPLAILAAIFSSEFLSRKTKAVVKPTVELMASLPSVVLGFLAAQVIAPFVDDVLSVSIAALVTTPLVFGLMAYLFQLVPSDRQTKLARYRILYFLPALVLGLAFAALAGPVIEAQLFSGDVKAWLSYSGRPSEAAYASAFGGWMLLLLPLCSFAALIASQRYVLPWVRTISENWPRNKTSRFELLRFGVSALIVLVGTMAMAGALDGLGFDPRAPLKIWGINLAPMGEYTQRNSLIVGFVMGFAIIPIIYTLADDALTAVPNHLRSAALGAGATPWQTAMRVVVPTAISGILSALMVGLGRAVGETMIVLMATGNTPILEFNGFSGFRTLAANIAYEIPEAVRDSTHYRTLFLAALVLFLMTFVINTCAESIRLRFRERANLL
ncbi:MAG: phosphate transport system permease protein [Planctomycetota bacterium]|jgi:phosphate transport system permease protein